MAQDDDKPSVSDLMIEGREALQAEDWAEAAATYKKVVEMQPDNGEAWHLLGYAYHAGGELEKAIPAHLKGAESKQYKAISLYNLGCAYSLKKDADKAFDYLNQAAAAGFDDVHQVKSDPDMKNIKDDERFEKLIARMKNGGKEPMTKKDSDKNSPFVGRWQIKSGSEAGEKVPQERLPVVVVTDDAFHVPAGTDEEFVMEYKIDKSKKPMEVDFKIVSGPIPEGKALGIIKIEKDEMTLCYDPTGAKRPEKFETSDENKCFLFSMKKMAEDKDDISKWIVGDWKCDKGTRGGADVGQERLETIISFTKERITIPIENDEKFVMSYELDTEKNPIAIDMKILEGPAPEGSAAVGIIKRDGDKFVLCYDPTGAERPSKFESTEDNGYFLFDMMRQK